jgi:ADP-heptose:LPS heptosyltransferase
MARLAGIPLRIGFNTESRGFLLNKTVTYDMNRPEAECYLDHLRVCGFPSEAFDPEPELEIWLTEEETEKAQSRFLPFDQSESGTKLKHVVVHLTSSNQAKEWPIEKSKEMIHWLLNQEHLHVHFLGAGSDHVVYDGIIESASDEHKPRLHNWCGEFSIRESAAFLKLMDLAVGVDSGTLHLARSVKTPTIVLFGPMSEIKWCPPGAMTLTHPMDCHPCHLKSPCHHEFSCIRQLSPQTVINACQTILKV